MLRGQLVRPGKTDLDLPGRWVDWEEHTPPDTPGTAAERAAQHPGNPDALLLTARLVSHPTDVWGPQAVLPHARALLRAAAAVTGHAHTDAVNRLREALINAGEMDLARIPAAG
ncbi:hypothetical protein AB0J01_28420 [Streptomyces sp. NPDC050204]|uniref:hypothetical protein n=1 Tax=Streptomyces sp. NPDC050204 TaxID=3155514 RepID=UPI0034460219